MRVRLLAFPVAAVCLLLGVSACGGNDSDSSDASAAVVEQIDAICDDWREALDAREEFPVEDFDTENPAAVDLPPVGDYLASGQSAAEDALESIRNLSAAAEVASGGRCPGLGARAATQELEGSDGLCAGGRRRTVRRIAGRGRSVAGRRGSGVRATRRDELRLLRRLRQDDARQCGRSSKAHGRVIRPRQRRMLTICGLRT